LNKEHEDQETEAPVLPEAERHALETALLANARAQHGRSKRFWTNRPTIGVSKTLLTASIIRASKYSGFSSRLTASFGGSVALSQAVRCIHGSFRSFAKEQAKSSRLLTTTAGVS
jgi:hypothetical protein